MWNRFRHSFGTRLAASGKIPSTAALARIMGNSAAVCEKHYLAHIPGQHDGLAGAMDAATVPPTVPQAGSGDLEAAASVLSLK